MSFQINCPNCGPRGVWEFHFSGPAGDEARPPQDADAKSWTNFIYNKSNIRGVQTEWWYHRSACKLWFLVERNTATNEVLGSRRYDPQIKPGPENPEEELGTPQP
jgi:heterotetrameric sarcosine oxidase delta subunit